MSKSKINQNLYNSEEDNLKKLNTNLKHLEFINKLEEFIKQGKNETDHSLEQLNELRVITKINTLKILERLNNNS
ncbi:MAG: hypothetical protein KJP09_00860 [Bacteroidia bacterium]|nr:hypothetical protein [Bacteroidia bacterium]MBT8311123.1 hypothetical protein [Bacteroidia bacterium]NND10234.1 hypothetical protein [Flavobacteriaceae bacterium]NNK28836.1 hypothetical protein [Flavobacteriaceae bacterium]